METIYAKLALTGLKNKWKRRTFKAETKKREQNLLHLIRNGQNEAQIVEDRVTKIGSSEANIREWMECYAEIFEFIDKRVTQIGK